MKNYWSVFVPRHLDRTVAIRCLERGIEFTIEYSAGETFFSVSNHADYEFIQQMKAFVPDKETYHGQQYIVVDTSDLMRWSNDQHSDYPGECRVMGSDPHTYGLLINAAEMLSDQLGEGRSKDYVQVFQLVPVSYQWVDEALKLVTVEGEDG